MMEKPIERTNNLPGLEMRKTKIEIDQEQMSWAFLALRYYYATLK